MYAYAEIGTNLGTRPIRRAADRRTQFHELNGNRAVRRRHCVGGGAPPVPKNRRKFFSEISKKISFCPQNFLMTFFSHTALNGKANR